MISEGAKIKLTRKFNQREHSPNFAGHTATIVRMPNKDNSGYIVQIDGTSYRYQVQKDEFRVLASFRQCSHDNRWEFIISGGGRAAVRFPDVIYHGTDLEYSKWDTFQEIACDIDLFSALRMPAAHEDFMKSHSKLYAPTKYTKDQHISFA